MFSYHTGTCVSSQKCVCVLLGRFFFLFGGGGGGSQLVIYDTDSYCKHLSAWVCCTYRLKGHLSVHSHFLLRIFEAPQPATHSTTHTHTDVNNTAVNKFNKSQIYRKPCYTLSFLLISGQSAWNKYERLKLFKQFGLKTDLNLNVLFVKFISDYKSWSLYFILFF